MKIFIILTLFVSEVLASECPSLSGKYQCDQNSVMKIFRRVADDVYTYRFGVVGKWDFIADGKAYPMKGWPEGSSYKAHCEKDKLVIEQEWFTPHITSPCGDGARKIVFESRLDMTSENQFTFLREEFHHCNDGSVIVAPSVRRACALSVK